MTWRARIHQQCDFALLVTCHTTGDSGTRRAPGQESLARAGGEANIPLTGRCGVTPVIRANVHAAITPI